MTPSYRLQTLGLLALSDADGKELLRRRINLALLAVLVERSPQPVKRDTLLAMFWGERSEERARHSLRQVILHLRRLCGDALVVQPETIQLVSGVFECDVQQFTEAALARRWREAIQLWTGPFLPGCESIGIDEFRVWLEVERERLRLILYHCFEEAVSAAKVDDSNEVLALTKRWVTHFPLDEAAHLQHIRALYATGESGEAVSIRGAFMHRLLRELEQEPSKAWVEASDSLAAACHPTPRGDAAWSLRVSDTSPGHAAHITPFTAEASAFPPSAPSANTRTSWRGRAALVAAAAIVATLGAFVGRIASARPHPLAVIAIGLIRSDLPNDSARGFATLLNIDLARVVDLNVVSERRMTEVAAARRTDGIDAIARASGAQEIIDGVLERRLGHTLRADLRRTDLETGQTRAAYSVEARDLTELADLITERIAHDLGSTAPAGRRDASTSSVLAYRLYEKGLQEYYDDQPDAARRSFNDALAEDSTFAMAALYGALVAGRDSGESSYSLALRLAQGASERERLYISAIWARHMRDARALAWADTLLRRYPMESEARLIYASEMELQRRYPASLARFRQVVELDSASRSEGPFCRACEGVDGLVRVSLKMDSTAAAERYARMRVKWQPHSPAAWLQLAGVFGDIGKYAQAHAATDSATKYSTDPTAPFAHTIWWFRTGDFAAIDAMWRGAVTSPKPDVRLDGLWTGVISLRTQGRVAEALAVARQFRRESAQRGNGDAVDMGPALLEAITLMEKGKPILAAALFDSMAARPQSKVPARLAAHWAMHLTFKASALAMAGGARRLASLEDSVRVLGAAASSRYHDLHYFVRGLRLSAAGSHGDAAIAFKHALGDPKDTYVRVYLELARSLIAANRPGEAIHPLVSALAGPTSAMGLYATRTELLEMLGRAYERNGQPDSAIAQYQRVSHAWNKADHAFKARHAAIDDRIAALMRPRPLSSN